MLIYQLIAMSISNGSNTKCIKEVILYCVGKINASKAWVAGSSYSPFKTHHADSVYFNQQGWSCF